MKNSVVVILDDDDVFLEAAVMQLSEGATVVPFTDGEAFLKFVHENADGIDLACVDLNMEDLAGVKWSLGGLHVILELKRTLPGDKPRICAITGMDKLTHIDMCLRHGADDFIEKGDAIGAFADQVRERLDAYA